MQKQNMSFLRKVKKIVFFLGSLFLLIAFTLIYAIFDYYFKDARQEQFEQMAVSAKNLFNMKVQEKQKSLSFQLDQMLHKENLAQAVFSKEHEKIKSIVAPFYEDLKISNEDIKILTFRSKENTTLYRAHKPEFYNDMLDQKRKIILDTNSLMRSFSGFEVGALEVTYRVTKPIFYKEEYVGSVEIGLDPKNILKDLSSLFKTDIGVAISNSFLDVMLEKSIVYIGDRHFLISGNRELEEYFSNHDKKSHRYRVDTSLALTNHLNEKLGFLVLGFNFLQDSKGFMERLFISIVIVIGFLSAVLLFSFYKAVQYFKDNICVKEPNGSFDADAKSAKIIQNALKKNRVIPYFQPVVDSDGKIVKYEALMRIVDLQKKEQNILSPHKFLNESIKSELYISLSKDMIRKSLHFFSNRDEKISINFLPNDLFNLIIMDEFVQEIKKFDSPQRVVVEITEKECVQNFSKLLQIVKKLRALGVLISIDDFDNSYAQYMHILAIKPDYIKIKGHLVQNLLKDDNAKNLIQSIVKLAKESGIKTIAEFVEDKETFDALKKYDIDEFQGYYFGHPTDLINNQ
ncbi:EAL domain-containing protein [Sulfurimonas sp.]|uniref:EAL domain-containing protein n=1 Tax=Sulfurimonas sp. TaxID=2022749 RepID=UPI002634CED9|nr:EAL domain-containing protein [Sulfurimonas sp.]MDD3854994.1 EAL domain-containing protein [Sulfurimonas sp.]